MQVAAWFLGVLTLASLASLAVGRPWTTLIAKRHNPREVWSTDLFHEINMIVSACWSLSFAVGAALALTAPMWINAGYGLVLFTLGHRSPRLGAWYASRRLRSMGVTRSGDP